MLLARALKLTGSAVMHLSDDGRIDGWALPGVEAPVAAGYLSGFPHGSLRPLSTETRAPAVRVLAMVLQAHGAPS